MEKYYFIFNFIYMSDINITDKDFEDKVIKGKGITMVDFWAPWCGPCKMMGPIIEDVAKEIKDKAKVYKLNVDENPETAEKYNVMSIPTIIIFVDGKEVEQMTGMQPKEILIEKLKK